MEQKVLHNDKNNQTPIRVADLIKKGDDVEISELDKSGNVQRRWLHRSDNTIAVLESETEPSSIIHSSVREWKRFLSDAFLPIGFPHSVSNDYLAYQTYDSLQAFFSTITSLLANRALLQGLGVGDADSSATFAMLITILTDATVPHCHHRVRAPLRPAHRARRQAVPLPGRHFQRYGVFS
ncbi:hypothetical protein J3458_004323 [Metarhizium acridum]|uniref:uncharacterized protein n=1 Tax=Metarhizium acridum TaxID=92637 RepID=UPI001C6D128C|nr:hypothetical protein J3458_004323 [Metarhizium acridum]